MTNEIENNYKVQSENFGEIKIANDIIAVIAGLAIEDIEGVDSQSNKMLGIKTSTKGIKTTLNDNEVEIDVPLVIQNGYNVMKVSSKVQDKVKESVENMTGFKVSAVNVKVAGVKID